VPKFFDTVLSKRAGEAVTLKGHWWDARRDVALEGVKEKAFKVGGAHTHTATAAGGSDAHSCSSSRHTCTQLQQQWEGGHQPQEDSVSMQGPVGEYMCVGSGWQLVHVRMST
jgi:hypothetical protein